MKIFSVYKITLLKVESSQANIKIAFFQKTHLLIVMEKLEKLINLQTGKD